jgi:HK97 family phage major capsid protein
MFKKFLETKGHTPEAFKALDAEKQAELQNEYLGTLETQIKALEGTVAEVGTLKTQLKALQDADKTEDLTTKLNDLAGEIQTIKDNGGSEPVTAKLHKELTEKKEALKGIIDGKKGEIEIKALTNRASVDGNTNAYVLPDIGQLGVVRRALYDVLPKTTLSSSANDNGIIKYHDWDEDTTVRAAEVVAEGVAFDESTAKFKEYTLPLRKIGDTLPVTEEFGEDVALAAAELERFLDVNVQTKVDNEIINGDNTGQRLKGLLTSVPTYTPVASAISFANIKDLARKMRTAIIKPRGSKYNVDIVVMNSDTFDKYYLAKDQDGNYLFDENGRIAGLTVVEDNNMPDNQMVVGDRRFARIYEKGGVVISEGFVNEQYIEDVKTIKARKRIAMLIREVDKTGFLKCTDIETALETLSEGSEPSV